MIPHRTDQLPADVDRRDGLDIGPYRLLEPIGGGSLTCVYRAEHRLLGALAAIKVLRPVYESEAAARQRLADEARLTSALSHHPNIVTAQDFLIDGAGRMGLVLELLRGRSLAERDTALPIGDVLAIGEQIADALAEVHAAGVVHGDLGPGNVLVTADELGRARAVLIDFGLAVAHGGRTGAREGSIPAGTPGYRSPEQERGDTLDQRSDVYGFGALLGHLVCGRAPAGADDFRAALVAALSRTPSSPAAESARFVIARELEELAGRCLADDPAQRPGSAAELRDRLRALAELADGTPEPKPGRLELEILSEPGPLPFRPPAPDAYDEIEIPVDDAGARDASDWDAPKLRLSDWAPKPPRQVGSAVAAISLLLVVVFGLVALMARAMLVDPALLPGEHAAVQSAIEAPAVQEVLHPHP